MGKWNKQKYRRAKQPSRQTNRNLEYKTGNSVFYFEKRQIIIYSNQNIALSLFGVYVLARYFVPLKLRRSLNSDSSMADSEMPGEVFLVKGRL